MDPVIDDRQGRLFGNARHTAGHASIAFGRDPAGNRPPRSGKPIEQAVTEYPGYLTSPANRLCEPAGAMNIVTIGSLSHGDGIGPRVADNVGVQPTLANEPSPFSRVGPGLRGAIRLGVVDMGGTLIYDPVVMALRGGEQLAEAGVMSLHYRPADRLLLPDRTSYSAPLVAFKAA